MVIKSAKKIAAKWARVTADRTQDYEDGVRNPEKDWENETVAAESRYEDGIQAAIKRKAFSKGVKQVGTKKQQANSIIKGIIRWPEGVRGAEADMEKGMAPIVDILTNLNLPPRYSTGDPRNIERVKAIQKALHDYKINK